MSKLLLLDLTFYVGYFALVHYMPWQFSLGAIAGLGLMAGHIRVRHWLERGESSSLGTLDT